jgi:hypothetical protein
MRPNRKAASSKFPFGGVGGHVGSRHIVRLGFFARLSAGTAEASLTETLKLGLGHTAAISASPVQGLRGSEAAIP